MQTNYVNRIHSSRGPSSDPISMFSTTNSLYHCPKAPQTLRSTIDLGSLSQFTRTSGYSSNQANASTKKAKKDTFSSTTKDALSKTFTLVQEREKKLNLLEVKPNNMNSTGYHSNVSDYIPAERHEMRPELSNKYLFKLLKTHDPIEAENKGSGPFPNTTTNKNTFTPKQISQPYKSGSLKSLDDMDAPEIKHNTAMFAGGHNSNKVVTVWPRYAQNDLITTQKQCYKSYDGASTERAPQNGCANANLKTGYFRISDSKAKFDFGSFPQDKIIEKKTFEPRKMSALAKAVEQSKSCVSNGFQQSVKQISKAPFQAKNKFLSMTTATGETIRDPREYFEKTDKVQRDLTPQSYIRMYPKANYR